MSAHDLLADPQARQVLNGLAVKFGLSETEMHRAVEAAMAELSRGVERNTLSRGGLADLIDALGDPRHASRLDDPTFLASDAVTADGNAILGHILGGKDGSRAVAARVSRNTGIAESLIKMLLPYAASLLMAALSRMLQGGLGDILGKLPGGGAGGRERPTPRSGQTNTDEGPFGREFELPRQGDDLGLPQRDIPDQRRRREPTPPRQQPVPEPSGGIPEQQPLPLPGSGPRYDTRGANPFEDLTDVLRRGRGPTVDGGSLWSVVRNAIGGALGFSSKGVVGWLIRLIVVRYGWGILKRLLGRMIGGR